MQSSTDRTVFLVDMQSFYASVEKAGRPETAKKPVVVSGDPALRNGVVLAACPIAKTYGISTAERLGEALNKCPELVVIRPHMQLYIDVSMLITRTLEHYTDAVEPFSIDECFCQPRLIGTAEETAQLIQREIMGQTGVYARVGISCNKIRAKMATDMFAKKVKGGIYTLTDEKIKLDLWRQPVEEMFGVGSRMKRKLNQIGIYTIGDLANTPLPTLKKKWGVNGEVLWNTANGIDASPVTSETHSKPQQAVAHGMTLPRDYSTAEELNGILIELTEEVCRRCRANGVMGRTLSIGCTGGGFEFGFSRQSTLLQATNATILVYRAVKDLFHKFWNGQPVRQLYVSLGGLIRDDEYQFELFGDDREEYRKLESTTDAIKSRFGSTAIMRAVSAGPAGQAYSRAARIGGHYK